MDTPVIAAAANLDARTRTTRQKAADVTRARVAIAGATGYAGQELVRWMAGHPAARLTAAMSSAPDGPPRSLPALSRIWDGVVEPFSLDRLAENADVVFLALPEEAAARTAPALVERGVRIIDLSGAFRLRDAASREKWYPATRLGGLKPVYGLTERNYDAIAGAQLVTNPGCYPTAALLALGPLADAGLLTESDGNISAYGVFGHRHQPEIEQELGAPVVFVPHYVPLDRGILETIYARLRPGMTAQHVGDAMLAAYRHTPFVRLTGDTLPELKHVAHTNFCDIGWRVDPSGRLLMVSVIDNLLKGAAGQAIQNLNVLLGLDERTGLLPIA
jgi:N-acetyl-gamma-glutamyl-phosphate reductase